MDNFSKQSYDVIEFEGSMLVDGFSVYVLEITDKETQKIYYYVGMTGDHYYHSARAGFYRLAAHLEYHNKKSTQNQLLKGLMKVLDAKTRSLLERHLPNLYFKMHHYNIEGYQFDEKIKLAHENANYQNIRVKVRELENAIIYFLKDRNILNETKGIKATNKIHFQELFNKIIQQINE